MMDNLHQHTVTCNTDGFETDEGWGVRYIITIKNNGSTIYKNNIESQTTESVFETELTAIRMAHEYLCNHSQKHILRTNSLLSIQSITTLIKIRSRAIKDC